VCLCHSKIDGFIAPTEYLPQIVVFAAYNVLEQNDPEGWQLMHCLRSFSILDLFLAFEVHTDESIAAGREELRRFGDLIKVCKYFGDSMMLTFTRFIFNYLQIP
jgi:hypothetical protein